MEQKAETLVNFDINVLLTMMKNRSQIEEFFQFAGIFLN